MGSEYEVGQDVRVTKLGHHIFPVGAVVTLLAYDPSQNAWSARDFTGNVSTLYGPDEFEALSEPEPAPKPDVKATNPKDAIGSTKLGFNLVPDTLKVYAALAFTEGATKYGSYNWRVAGVRASIYKAALERHLAKWWNGEDADAVTKVPHLASVIACAAIILDAELVGKLTDDRPPKANVSALIDGAQIIVEHLLKLHEDKNPTHYTEKGV